MASKGKGKAKNTKKDKIVEELPPAPEEKKEDESEEKQDEVGTEEGTAEEQEPPKEPTPPPEYDEPTLAELIVESFEGEKVRGLFDGEGTAYFSGGHVYQGQFSQGLMHGKGVYTWSDGVRYEGDFNMNEITGKGLYTWPDKSTYEGEVLKGRRHGQGMFRCTSTPSSYTGQWNNGKRHGTGIIRYDLDGLSFYEGDWVTDMRQGYGVRRYRSGNVYEGEWMANNRHGQGIMRWVDLDQSFNGQWVNGVQNGHGEHTWYLRRLPGSQYPLRNQYIGDFHQGLRHGYGVFLYANGAKFEGEWVENKKCGRGLFTFKNGRIFEGVFVDDRMAEYPAFSMDGNNTPDISNIRTRTPDPSGPGLGDITSRSDASRNTLGPSLTLELDHLLNDFSENDREEEIRQVMFVVLRHITTFKKVYNFYGSLGHDASPDNTFIMTRLQFWRFLKDCQFHYNDLTLTEMDRILAPNKTATDIHNPLDKLLMREFLNNLITLSYQIYQEECTSESGTVLSWCLSKAMTDNIVPAACDVQGTFLYEPRRAVNALGYMDKCWEIYCSVSSPNKHIPYEPTLKMRQFLYMLKDYRLINDILTPKRILEVLAADDPGAYDAHECNLELEMTFLEFFEALIGCAMIYVTEDIVKDPSTPRPSTVISHTHSSFSATTAASASRASQPLDDSEEQGTTGPGSPHHTGVTSESMSPGPRVASSTDATNKGSGLELSAAKVEVQGSVATGSQHTDVGLDPSNTNVDPKALKSDALGLAASSHSGPGAPSIGGEETQQPHLLQSMLSMGAEQNEMPEEEPEEDMDEETRQFNFWTHQIHIFFIRKLFRAHEHMNKLEETKKILQTEKEAATIEAQHQREKRIAAYEAAREAERLAEAKAKELAAAAAAAAAESKDVDLDSGSSQETIPSPTKGR
ncbi:radial spoke head 10 homolog B-like [Patiria miniata]|uniref:Radial spoke head 10 homolog B n=1 Tax=Patiria miniata TaxID=46514 RepID=A0A913Z6W7_PATMI|nr:radial spoke head 10 homolog B-like [Patiria miniata]